MNCKIICLKYKVFLLLLLYANNVHSQLVKVDCCDTKESVFDYKVSGNGEPFKMGIDSINILYSRFSNKTEKSREPNRGHHFAFFKLTVDSIGNAKTVDIIAYTYELDSISFEKLRLFILTLFPTNIVIRQDKRDGGECQLLEFEISVMYNEDSIDRIRLSLPPNPEKEEDP